MKGYIKGLTVVYLTLSILWGCRSVPPSTSGELFQFSTLPALVQGVYEGEMTIAELKKKGDLGLGTLDNLDGELVVLDGVFYQVKYDGTVVVVDDEAVSPLAIVAFFQPEVMIGPVAAGDYDELEKLLDGVRTTENLPFVFKIEGEFEYVKTRSVAAQSRPYPLLARALEEPAIFEFSKLEGATVGFWMPAYFDGVNVPGYHLHFLSSDRLRGGHLLDCRLKEGRVKAASLSRFSLVLPGNRDFLFKDLAPSARYDPRGGVKSIPAPELVPSEKR